MAVQSSTGGTYLSSFPGTNLPNTSSAVTLAGWVNYNGWTTATTNSMFGMYNGNATSSITPTTAIQIGSRAVAGQIHVWTWGGARLINTATGSPVLTNNEWVHVVYTCTAVSGGNQTRTIYVNGVQAATETNATQIAGALTQVYINGYPQAGGGTGESGPAIVDDILVFNRALPISEIQTLYTCRGMRDGITFGLVARYTFQEAPSGNVSSCVDYSGSASPLISGAGTPLTYILGYSNQHTRPL